MVSNVRMTILELLLFFLATLMLFAIARADNSAQDQLRQVMQENFDAMNYEDLPRLLNTMSVEMPQRELFVQQTNAEWAVSDLYYRLDDLRIVRQNQWRPPYAVATIRQTITGNEGQVTNPGLSDLMSLNTNEPSTECEVLFKRENSRWKIVAGLTKPRPVGSKDVEPAVTQGPCANGQCRWPKTR